MPAPHSTGPMARPEPPCRGGTLIDERAGLRRANETPNRVDNEGGGRFFVAESSGSRDPNRRSARARDMKR
jgi:hypothetical protein